MDSCQSIFSCSVFDDYEDEEALPVYFQEGKSGGVIVTHHHESTRECHDDDHDDEFDVSR
jgi:hypothetical protein